MQPKLTHVFQRDRLFRTVDEARKKPITWVSAPGGSGKTTLVASYLHSRRLPCLWYQADQEDGDIATFFYFMALAAKKAAPRHRKPLPLLTPEYLYGVTAFTYRYFEDLYKRLKTPFILVIDNYQDVPVDSALHERLCEGLSRVPEGISIVIISRVDPPPAFARLRANGLIAPLTWQEVRFSLDETRALAWSKYAKFSEADVDVLHARTEGWAAGLVLLMERGLEAESNLRLDENLSREEIFDYFAREVFQKTDKDSQQLLLSTSVLRKTTGRMAGELTGLGQAERILSDLNRNNYFTEKRPGKEPVYQYHPLFREFLQSHAKVQMTPAALAGILQTATLLLEKAGEVEDAAGLCIQGQAWEKLDALILSYAKVLIAQGRSYVIEDWIKKLPQELVERNPWVLFWLGTCRMTANFTEARTLFEKAFDMFQSQGDPAGSYLSWAGAVDSIVYEWADFSRLDKWIDLMHRIMKEYPLFPSNEIEGRVAGSMIAALMYYKAQHPEINAWAERIHRHVRKSSDGNYRIMIGNQLALYHLWWTGDHAKLSVIMDLLRPSPENPAITPLARIIWLTIEGLESWIKADFEKGLRNYHEGRRVADTSGVHIWDFMLYMLGICCYLGSGNHKVGKPLIEQFTSRMDRSQQMNMCHFLYTSSWQAMLAGDPARALEQTQISSELADRLGGSFLAASTKAVKAQALYACGRKEEALRSIEESDKLAQLIHGPLLIYRNYLIKAYFALDQGNESHCIQMLRQGLPIAREKGYINFSWWRPSIMTPLFIKALEAGIEVDYVQHIIRKRGLFPENPPSHLEAWPWPVKIYALGKFELLHDEKLAMFSGKVQQKPLAMLKVMIALGAENVPDDMVMDALWPDAEGDLAKKSFDTTLHRLRKLLGNEKAILLQEKQLSLDRRQCWVDVWAFEEAVRSSECGMRNENNTKKLERTIDLYHGHFLPMDVQQPWTFSIREKLRTKYLSAVSRLGNYHVEQGQFEKAVVIYEKGLEIEDTVEEFYQGLMLGYQRLGKNAEAVRVFDRCKRVLFAKLQLAPSERTKQIYANINRKK